MKILVIGSGGREHALAWRLAQSPRVSHVVLAPGNDGAAQEEGVHCVPVQGIDAWLDRARREQVAFTVVGPEAPVAAGIVNRFRDAGQAIFGPTLEAAELEISKDYAKRFMHRHGIPTAHFSTFEDPALAHAHLEQVGAPIVIKADGLAAGKGVVVAQTLEEAHHAVDAMLGGGLGEAGRRVVIEEFLTGEEASFIVMAEGEQVLPLATSQDHKRLRDHDEGPNTGGMGAYSPAPVITPTLHGRIMREIIQPTLQGMLQEGRPYTGFLYAGLMISPQGTIKVLEYNCRLGDPETQPLLMRLKTDLVDLIEAALEGRLRNAVADWDRRPALGVVLAAPGYPEHPVAGSPITGLDTSLPDTHLFHAGTRREGKQWVTQGGRVLCVTALGDTLKAARHQAYEQIQLLHFDGMQYRQDIGWRALKPHAPSKPE
jgi:phosphoribosylamine--glycine ligase